MVGGKRGFQLGHLDSELCVDCASQVQRPETRVQSRTMSFGSGLWSLVSGLSALARSTASYAGRRDRRHRRDLLARAGTPAGWPILLRILDGAAILRAAD